MGLPNQDLRSITTAGSPADGVEIPNRHHLSTIDLACNGRAREFSIGAGSWSRASFPSSTAAHVHLDGAQLLISQVAAGPSRGIFVSGGQRCEQLCFARACDVACGVIAQVEDELTLIVAVLARKLE